MLLAIRTSLTGSPLVTGVAVFRFRRNRCGADENPLELGVLDPEPFDRRARPARSDDVNAVAEWRGAGVDHGAGAVQRDRLVDHEPPVVDTRKRVHDVAGQRQPKWRFRDCTARVACRHPDPPLGDAYSTGAAPPAAHAPDAASNAPASETTIDAVALDALPIAPPVVLDVDRTRAPRAGSIHSPLPTDP